MGRSVSPDSRKKEKKDKKHKKEKKQSESRDKRSSSVYHKEERDHKKK